MASRLYKRIGQPIALTHPHLLKPNELTIGLSHQEYAHRRSRILSLMPERSAIILVSAAEQHFGHDIHYHPYRQNSNLFYLTGFEQPKSVCILSKGFEKDCHYALLVEQIDTTKEKWIGPKANLDTAREIFNTDCALPIKMQNIQEIIDKRLDTTSQDTDPPMIFIDSSGDSDIVSQIKTFLSRYNLQDIPRDNHYIERLRLLKSTAEQDVMKRASSISSNAFIQAMQFTRPGISEHQLAAIIEFNCKLRGCRRMAYPPIVAGGENGTILHYTNNDQILRDGDLVLVDAGAEFGGYASDVTRTWPVNGKFSVAQREIYELVLDVQRRCIEECGSRSAEIRNLKDIHQLSVKLLVEGILELGIFSFSASVDEATEIVAKKLYPHGLGHYLGIDTHDTPHIRRSETLLPGCVFTVEPGIYIDPSPQILERYHNIAVRIEDNVLLCRDPDHDSPDPVKYEVLTSETPKSISEIESLCAKSAYFSFSPP